MTKSAENPSWTDGFDFIDQFVEDVVIQDVPGHIHALDPPTEILFPNEDAVMTDPKHVEICFAGGGQAGPHLPLILHLLSQLEQAMKREFFNSVEAVAQGTSLLGVVAKDLPHRE